MIYKYEFEILVNRIGNVLVYMRYNHNNTLKFLSYARTLEGAVTYCADHPTRIVTQGK